MSRTGVDSLDRSIDKTNAWLADVAANFGTEDRRLAYRVTRSWLHTLRDRLPVTIAAHVAAQLPELLRGVFYEGWNPSKVPIKYTKDEYIARFARDAQVHHDEVARAGRLVTSALRQHISAGAIDEVLGALPTDIRSLIVSPDTDQPMPAAIPQQTGVPQQAGEPQQAGSQQAGSQQAGAQQAGAQQAGGKQAGSPQQAGTQQQAADTAQPTDRPGPAGDRGPAGQRSPAAEHHPAHDINPSPGGGDQ
jgi:uncharacterized protein (DUF2267 family)